MSYIPLSPKLLKICANHNFKTRKDIFLHQYVEDIE